MGEVRSDGREGGLEAVRGEGERERGRARARARERVNRKSGRER